MIRATALAAALLLTACGETSPYTCPPLADTIWTFETGELNETWVRARELRLEATILGAEFWRGNSPLPE